jgi:hypothetical protein
MIVNALISPVGGVSYTLSAKMGNKRKAGTCKAVNLGQGQSRRKCTIKLTKGTWALSVTPRRGSTAGTANKKTYRLK